MLHWIWADMDRSRMTSCLPCPILSWH